MVETTDPVQGHYEIVSLVGTIDPDGQHHLHISISDSEGATFGGHVWSDHIIYTTGNLFSWPTLGLSFGFSGNCYRNERK